MRAGLLRRLPSRPSDLIRLALKDLAEVAKDPDYAVDMGHWHMPSGHAGVCAVCLAGAVMAVTLRLPHDVRTGPDHYRRGIERKLLALDSFRQGDVAPGVRQMGLRPPLDIDLPPFMRVPAYGAPGFTEAMEGMAARLRRANL